MAEVPSNTEKDAELEELLDSALEDFDKPSAQQNSVDNVKKEAADLKNEESWNSEFLLEAQKTFENNMKALFGPGGDGEISPEQFGEQLQKIADEANKVLTEHSHDPEFSATIAQTLKNLTENSEKLQGNMEQDALTAMLGGLGLGTEEDTSGDFMPFMQSMMQSFLSKEVLYPSIKEITEKYPIWLQENKDGLSEADYNNYNKQYEIMNQVCIEFEKETDNDSEDTKKGRFMKVLSLMEEMQKLGQPPKDLCDDSPFAFNENGSPTGLPGVDPSQCSVM